MIRSRILAVAALTVLPLASAPPAEATTVPCGGAYPTAGVFALKCPFVYLGGSITASIDIIGAPGHKYITVGVHPGGQYCERESYNTLGLSCSFNFTPSVPIGTAMWCSCAAVGRPVAVVNFSCN